MNRKTGIISFCILAIFTFTVWAVTANGPAKHHTTEKMKVEQVSNETGETSKCDPSACTPQQKANCAPGNVAASDCPATKECPPSKCEGQKGEASTATL